MGIFGFACSKCWDYNCNCTPEELQKNYEEKQKLPPIINEVSITKPHVTKGDIIVLNNNQYFITDVIKGLPQIIRFTNNLSIDNGQITSLRIKDKYQIFKSIIV